MKAQDVMVRDVLTVKPDTNVTDKVLSTSVLCRWSMLMAIWWVFSARPICSPRGA
jgi:hypothetical protein